MERILKANHFATIICSVLSFALTSCLQSADTSSASSAAAAISCAVSNGSGMQITSSGKSLCFVQQCNSGYHSDAMNSSCVSSTQSCSVAGGTGTQTWINAGWGSCVATSCTSGYSIASGTCTATSPNLNCSVTSHASGSSCVANTQSCSITNGTGAQSWTGSAWGACTPSSCSSGYSISNNACLANINSVTLQTSLPTQLIGIPSLSVSASTNGTLASMGLALVNSSGLITQVASTAVTTSAGCTSNGGSYSTCAISFDTRGFANGTYSIYAFARTTDGNTKNMSEQMTQIYNSTVPPTASITSPTSGATISGMISISTTYADALTILSAYVTVDGASGEKLMGFGSPAQFYFDTLTLTNGAHVLYLTVTDQSENVTTVSVNVTVSNAGTSISQKTQGNYSYLEIDGSSAVDTILVSQVANHINVTVNGTATSYTGPFQWITINGYGGADQIIVDSTVNTETLTYCHDGCTVSASGTIRNTVVTVGAVSSSGSPNTITGNATTSVWTQTADQVSGVASYRSHVVASFTQPPEPADIGSETDATNYPLWGAGPVMYDVNQGQAGDCYFLTSNGMIAGGTFAVNGVNETDGDPGVTREVAVELPGGQVLVQYYPTGSSTPGFVAITKRFNLSTYTYPGSNGTVWVSAVEKAFTYFRTYQNTYASIDSGTAREVFGRYGLSLNNTIPQIGTPSLAVWAQGIISIFQNQQATALLTSTTTDNIVASHDYGLLWTRTDGSGNRFYTVRNPWGFQPGYSNVGGVFEVPESTFTANFRLDAITAYTPF